MNSRHGGTPQNYREISHTCRYATRFQRGWMMADAAGHHDEVEESSIMERRRRPADGLDRIPPGAD